MQTQERIQPQAHTQAQPGLRGHSWNPDTDLLKRYVLERSLGPERGWLALASFDVEEDARQEGVKRELAEEVVYRIRDQFAR